MTVLKRRQFASRHRSGGDQAIQVDQLRQDGGQVNGLARFHVNAHHCAGQGRLDMQQRPLRAGGGQLLLGFLQRLLRCALHLDQFLLALQILFGESHRYLCGAAVELE